MRNVRQISPAPAAPPPCLVLAPCPVESARPGNDTSLDYRERTISRTEDAVLANGLISAEVVHLRTAKQAGSRAETASRKWSGFGVRR